MALISFSLLAFPVRAISRVQRVSPVQHHTALRNRAWRYCCRLLPAQRSSRRLFATPARSRFSDRFDLRPPAAQLVAGVGLLSVQASQNAIDIDCAQACRAPLIAAYRRFAVRSPFDVTLPDAFIRAAGSDMTGAAQSSF